MKFTAESGREYKLTILQLWPDFGTNEEYWQSTGLLDIEHEGKKLRYRRENWDCGSACGYEEQGDLSEVVHDDDLEEVNGFVSEYIDSCNASARWALQESLKELIDQENSHGVLSKEEATA